MKLLSFIVALLVLLPSGSSGPKDYWDILLDKYEALCDACKEKKSKREIKHLSESLNEHLQHPEGKMSQAQRERFASIQNKYRGFITFSDKSFSETDIPRVVIVDTVRRVEHIRVTDTVFVKEVIGSIELNQYIHNRDTVYHIIQYQPPIVQEQPKAPVPEDVAMSVATPTDIIPARAGRPMYFVLADISVGAEMSCGASVGVIDKWGGYAGFVSNFSTISPGYSCTSDGKTGATRIMANGSRAFSRIAVTAGACYEVNDWLTAYSGAGYGQYRLFWQDIDGTWAEVLDKAAKGPELEAGGILHLGVFGLSFGAATTCFKRIELKAGIGLVF